MRPQNQVPPTLPVTWQAVLRDAVRSIGELAELLGLPAEMLLSGQAAAEDFPLLVPRGFVARMQPGDARDPLLRQVLPDAQEAAVVAGFGDDPVGESAFARRGVVNKYASRALVVTTAACPVHCRYCFRRAFDYADNNAAHDDWRNAIDGLQARRDATEVILSGGDPLSLGDRRLANLVDRIVALGHIDTLRIHTRFPVMIPERVTPKLLALLTDVPLQTVVVVHVNHPNEIDAPVRTALEALRSAATAVLNQSVLLRGINDDAATLSALSRRLLASGVLPYYLHMLDKVTGSAHFLVEDTAALALMSRLRATLPGYLVPRLVRETPGELSKTPIN